ncbi:protein Mis18-alpha-like [Glandiceps talaboti]
MAGEMNTDVVSMLFKNAVSVGEDDGSDDMAQAEFVIQCSGCLHVLSDSTMVGSTEEQLAVIAVKRVTDNVTEDRKITISQSGLDEASCFRYLRCKKCTTVLGKRYRTTTVELDHIRDHYCLYVDEIDW